MPRPRKTSAPPKDAQSCRHLEAELPVKSKTGAQSHFKRTEPHDGYRFDSSLRPSLQRA
jgi:hypothetical protein